MAGQEKALRLADKQGVSINYHLANADSFTIESESINAVALIYAHFQPVLRQRLHYKVKQWLQPGGTVILEAFHPKQLGYTSGGPKDESMLYTADMLQQDFAGMAVKVLEEKEIILREGAYHSGPGFVIRFVATKPKAQIRYNIEQLNRCSSSN
ncbi:hypothetical protein K3G39_01365 [Pontibacter sp. HSC-14F20]|uniref:class I SAM-dependent methyltransferase n=1 Tax=Pontibacter sp. HSC-14F20 TaxID=2864136 RepID=UPI001C73ADF3|nr:class I SAM-dependent methyltransferase [Pontibacter sp. HSC-14F20]MBX0331879.1 hypothetical protein [Pontibacter sp. HSC-14F20]